MTVESDDSLSPIELDHHEAIQIGIVLGARQVVVSLNQSVSSWLSPGEEVVHLSSRVVVDVSECLDVGKPLDIATIVLQPNCSVEGHLVVLT